MLSILLIAAALAGADPTPVAAARGATATRDTSATAAAVPAAKVKRYCIKDVITGSRLPRKKCQTRDEWLREGFDPTEKL